MSKEEKKKVFSAREASWEFIESFPGHGSLVQTCEGCERTYFSNKECTFFEYEEGEYEYLVKMAEENPDSYIEIYEDGVNSITIDNCSLVIGCDCNKIGRYESFIRSFQDEIVSFYKKIITEKFNVVTM